MAGSLAQAFVKAGLVDKDLAEELDRLNKKKLHQQMEYCPKCGEPVIDGTGGRCVKCHEPLP